MALANCPAPPRQQRSLRRMCQVLSWALARSPGRAAWRGPGKWRGAPQDSRARRRAHRYPLLVTPQPWHGSGSTHSLRAESSLSQCNRAGVPGGSGVPRRRQGATGCACLQMPVVPTLGGRDRGVGDRVDMPHVQSCLEEPRPVVDRAPVSGGSAAGGEEDLRQRACRAHSGRRIATSLSAHRQRFRGSLGIAQATR
jgi:hypothetical protein